ncbi:hypothetical protein OEA41_003385 [Lepraria neglecta]|uniref:Metallo-beta-lactamase domain-containing protein n=1 Tax=Lepraria neglecta TaxID=209136 RepID=A0AAD9Z4K3_9LECA|nr:hypothetical protein OEA41_003385 [Lepraria neglecta]
MLFHRSTTTFLALALTITSSAHPHHGDQRRDLAGVCHGPDSNETHFLAPSAEALGPAIDSKMRYRMEHIGNVMPALLQSTAPNDRLQLQAAIKGVTDQPVMHFVYSQAHSDHVGGAYIFNETITHYIAQVETLLNLEGIPTLDPARPIPNIIFQEEYKVCVGNQTLELSYKGPNHEPGNIFIYALGSKTIMVVDLGTFAELVQSDYIPGWIEAHYQILAHDFVTYIGGHLNRYGTAQDKEYVQDLFNFCSDAVNGGFNVTQSLGPTEMASPGNYWAEFKDYLKVASDLCIENTNKKREGKLAGLDAFGWENAYKMIESPRIDYGVLGSFAV